MTDFPDPVAQHLAGSLESPEEVTGMSGGAIAAVCSWGLIAAGGEGVRPRAILAIAGPSVTARTRTRRGLMAIQASLPPEVPAWHVWFPTCESAGAADRPSIFSLLVLPSWVAKAACGRLEP